MKKDVSHEFIVRICKHYSDIYDDCMENRTPVRRTLATVRAPWRRLGATHAAVN